MKRPTDPRRPNGWLWEDERQPDGRRTPTLTIFLAGAECPFACVFCDLWRQTLDDETPPGAIPTQIDAVLAAAGAIPAGAAIKLYNASNFFDTRAIPLDDDAPIATLTKAFDRIIVESHPRFIGQRCLEFAKRLHTTLEVAIGLETADPDVLSRLNKQMTLADVSDAAATLRASEIDLRLFLLVPPPYVPEADVVRSVTRSVTWAAEHGARHVSLIPTRTEYARDERLENAVAASRLDLLERVFDRCRDVGGALVSVDLWDLEHMTPCRACAAARIGRLRTMNLTGDVVPRVQCPACMSSS